MDGESSSFQIQCFTCGEWYSSDDPDVNVSMEYVISVIFIAKYMMFSGKENITRSWWWYY